MGQDREIVRWASTKTPLVRFNDSVEDAADYR